MNISPTNKRMQSAYGGSLVTILVLHANQQPGTRYLLLLTTSCCYLLLLAIFYLLLENYALLPLIVTFCPPTAFWRKKQRGQWKGMKIHQIKSVSLGAVHK